MTRRCGQPVLVVVFGVALWAVASLCAFVSVRSAHAQSPGVAVVPDGQSSTSAAVAPSGKITVDIAPANGAGLSHNSYSSFSVPKSGVDLNNNSVNANTILNEVTSAKRSMIEGALAVTGPKANVIVANPNGITVNGGSFVNMGGVGLVTGRVTSKSPLELSVEGGDVLIGAGGLSGTLQQLDLISKSIRITGAIPADVSGINIVAGSGTVTANTTVSPSAPKGWLTTTGTGASQTGASVVIESGAILNGGSISITANDKGAGVHMSGANLATAGDFTVSATGTVRLVDTQVQAKRNVALAGGNVELVSAARRTSLRSEMSGILIDATGRFSSEGALLHGNTRSTFGFSALGAVSVIAGQGIALSRNHFDSDVISDVEGVSFETTGAFSDLGSRVTSAGDIVISSGGTAAFNGSALTSKTSISVLSKGDAWAEGATMAATDSILLYVASLQLKSRPEQRTTITAEDGGVLIAALGDMVTSGALVQGSLAVKGDDRSRGGVTVATDGVLLVETIDQTMIGSLFAKNSTLAVSARQGIVNRSGRLLSNKNIILETAGAFDNGVARLDGVSQAPDGSVANRVFGSSRTVKDFGTYLSGREIGQVTAIEGVVIAASDIRNVGGEITGSDVELSAKTIANEPVRLGHVSVTRKCILLFCNYTGSSNVTRDGGTITASKSLDISAAQWFKNTGGNLIAIDALRITAPSIQFAALLMPSYYQRPGGLSSFMIGKWGRTFDAFDGGVLALTTGDIEFVTDTTVVIEGTAITTENAPKATHGLEIHNTPIGLGASNLTSIGMLRDVLP